VYLVRLCGWKAHEAMAAHLNRSRQAIIDRSFCSASSTSKYLRCSVHKTVLALTTTIVGHWTQRGVGNRYAGRPLCREAAATLLQD
jgi:hypothetical protein